MENKNRIMSIFIFVILISTSFIGTLSGGKESQETNNLPLLQRDLHDYYTMTSELQQIANDYPNITVLYDLGQSVQGRSIWGLKITDNPTIEENEPEVRICGAHHGNEYMSLELPLLLAWHLVGNYSVDTYITDLIDNREIWIIPLVNPDGRQAGTRYNANGVDLNRDYGYIWESQGGSSAPFSQPETKVFRQHALENNFVLSLSFHTSGDIVNYLWNHKGAPIADHDVVVFLSNMYGSYNGYWVVEGYDWYRITGDTNDFSYGCRGDMDWTIEVQNSNIPEAWNLNRDGMMDIIEYSNMGLRGIVTDNITDEPVSATVWVEEAYWPCFTDPIIGDYHKLLMAGNYTVHYQANGYEQKIFNVEVFSGDPTILNVSLDRNNENYAYQITWYYCYDPYSYDNNYLNNPTEGISALGPPDNISASIGKGGEIVLDMGPGVNISDISGDDFIVYDGDSNPEGYFVEVSENWDGPWISLGYGTGTSSFDLADGSIYNAKFVKIIDDDDGDAYEINPGFDLDAIKLLSNNTNANYSITNLLEYWNFMSLPFNQSVDKTDLVIKHEDVEYSWSDAVVNGYVNDYIFGWNRVSQGYEFTDTLYPGYGYWMFAYEACEALSSNVKDNFASNITILETNWNIVSIPDDQPINKEDIFVEYSGSDYTWDEAVTNGYINDNVFGWDRTGQSYNFADTFMSGYSYWIYAYYTCTLKQ